MLEKLKYAIAYPHFHLISLLAKSLKFNYIGAPYIHTWVEKPSCSVVNLFKWNSWPWEISLAATILHFLTVANHPCRFFFSIESFRWESEMIPHSIVLRTMNAWIDMQWTSSLCGNTAGAVWAQQVVREMCYISAISGSLSSLYLCR